MITNLFYLQLNYLLLPARKNDVFLERVY